MEAPGTLFTRAITALVLFAGMVASAVAAETTPRIAVVATLFPQYDFARQIAGGRADVSLLLPPGAESHSFEPTPSDMKNIAGADLFVYTGEYMEPWAKRLADSAGLPAGVTIVDASRGVVFRKNEEGGDEDDDHEHDHGESGEHAHSHLYDPHIWLDLGMAAVMADNIGQAMARRDPANGEFYLANAARVREELLALDTSFADTVAAASRRVLVFGERFAFGYFFSRYGLEYAGAYKSCAPGAEPGLKAVIEVVETVKRDGVKFVYLEDMSTGRISEVIHSETGAEILRVDSLHNPPAREQSAGTTFQEIMRRNMDAFAKGLR